MIVYFRHVAFAELAAHPRADPIDRPAAFLARRVGRVLAQVVLAQLLARAVRERGDPVGGHAEHGGDLGRGFLLDLGVPQDHPPALGELAEGEGGVAPLLALDGGVHVDLAGVVLGEVVGELDLLVAAQPVVEVVAEGLEHVGPEGEVGAAAFAEGVEEFGEGLGDEVVGAGGVA